MMSIRYVFKYRMYDLFLIAPYKVGGLYLSFYQLPIGAIGVSVFFILFFTKLLE